jgi:hypothetical protein
LIFGKTKPPGIPGGFSFCGDISQTIFGDGYRRANHDGERCLTEMHKSLKTGHLRD